MMRWGILAVAVSVALSGCQSATIQEQPTLAAPSPSAEQALATDEVLTSAIEPEQKAEPVQAIVEAPINDVWLRIQHGLQFPDVDNDEVRVQREWYLRNQEYMNRVASRADLYLFHIVESLEERNLPLDLALLPIVESAYQPYAYSRSRAAGIWQFIPSTGRLYDLDINWWQDGRRDVVRSTEAAMNYLGRLNKMFDGDWLLSLAAYNGGEGTIMRARDKNRKKGLPIDFWSLHLRTETSAYVPKMIALTQLLRDPDKYGFKWQPILNEPKFARVDVGSQIDLKLAAEMAEMSGEELYQLNPHFVRWATDPEGPHELLIPIDKVETFNQNIASLPEEKRVQWGVYTVRKGDVLGSIARQHYTSVAQIQRTNKLKNNMIRPGQTLLIPKQGGRPTKDSQLALSAPVKTKAAENGVHTVRDGENLWVIARANGLSVAQLKSLNQLDDQSVIKPGQLLKTNSAASIERAQVASQTSVQSKKPTLATNPHLSVKQIRYTVRNGDSLYKIASKFNVSVNELSKWNNWNKSKLLKPGQKLTVFVDQANLSGG